MAWQKDYLPSLMPGYPKGDPLDKTKLVHEALRKLNQQPPEKHKMHLREIPKGTFGAFSKIREEFNEADDAHEQGLAIIELWELADLVGAIRGYLNEKYPGITLEDLIAHANKMRKLFATGARKE